MKILHIIPILAIFMKSVMVSSSGTGPSQTCPRDSDDDDPIETHPCTIHIPKSHPSLQAIRGKAIERAPKGIQPLTSNSNSLSGTQTGDSRVGQGTLDTTEPSMFNLDVPPAEGWITKRTFENSILWMPRPLATMIVVYIIGGHFPGEGSDVEQQGSMKEGSEKISTASIILSLSMNTERELTTEGYIYELFEGLMREKDHDGICNIGRDLGVEPFTKYIFPSITTVEQYKKHYEFMNDNDLFSGFLVHGRMGLVGSIITGFPEQEDRHIPYRDMGKALVKSLNESDQYERFQGLLSAEEHVCKESNRCVKVSITTNAGIYQFLEEISPANNGISTPLKQFLTLHSQEFRVEYPVTYNELCKKLVRHLRGCSDRYSKAREILTDLVGQPDLLSSKAITDAFLSEYFADDIDRENFLTYAWREAVEEYMIGEDDVGRRQELWDAIVRRSPAENLNPHVLPLPGDLAIGINWIPTKLMREMEWTERNVPGYQERIRERLLLVLSTLFPGVLVNIILEYINLRPTATWLDIPSLH